jgi:NADP-reducing hydrogenase subunit HndB
MKSIEELKAIKAKNIGDVISRNEKGVPTINVHMGTCGIASGARETLGAILEEIQNRQIKNIHVVQSGCPGMCVHEPLVTVTIPGEKPYIYEKVTPQRAQNIIVRHIINHQPIQEWLINLEK